MMSWTHGWAPASVNTRVAAQNTRLPTSISSCLPPKYPDDCVLSPARAQRVLVAPLASSVYPRLYVCAHLWVCDVFDHKKYVQLYETTCVVMRRESRTEMKEGCLKQQTHNSLVYVGLRDTTKYSLRVTCNEENSHRYFSQPGTRLRKRVQIMTMRVSFKPRYTR